MVAISDVAKRARVSVGTVSRVINGHPAVAPEYRQRVEEAIGELGYRPNAFARSLRRQKSLTFGLVIPDVTDPFFAELVKHIDELAAEKGYSIVLGNSNNRADLQERYIEVLQERRVDGLIVVPSIDTKIDGVDPKLPLVIVDRPLKGHTVVASEHRRGAEAAVTYLIRLGHRKIACISGPKRLSIARERYKGFRAAMGGVPKQQRLAGADVQFAEFDYDHGYRAAIELLGRSARPTAIFASADQQAIGAIRAAGDLGLAVPEDVSIVGFDDIPLAMHVIPRLTTVKQDVRRISELALQAIQTLRDGTAKPQSVLVPVSLQIRASAAPLAKNGRQPS